MAEHYDERFEKLFNIFLEPDPEELTDTKKIRRLALKFFMVFSRFEYALKKAGYLKNNQIGADAKADWQTFADCQKSKDAFYKLGTLEDKRLKPAIEYMLAEKTAPKKQIVKENKRLDWTKRGTDGQSDVRKLVESITTVRNNLFHGAKITDISQEINGKRNFKLLDSSLIMLGYLLDFDSDVRDHFSKGL